MKKGFTLIEMMVVIFIFTLVSSMILTVLIISDRNWRLGQNKLIVQQEARRAMDNIVRLLRGSNPKWVIDGVEYGVSITSNNRIDFYQPLFDETGKISTLRKITFKLNPDNIHQLLKKEGQSTPVVIANEIESINFGGGCSGCSDFNCSSVANDCPLVKIEIKTKKKDIEFKLASQVILRNHNATASEVLIEQPAEGEF